MFDQATFDSGTRRMANPWTMSISVALQATIITTAILLPLLRIEPLPPVRLVAPTRAPRNMMTVAVPRALQEMFQSARLALPARTDAVRMIAAPRHVPAGGPQTIIDPGPGDLPAITSPGNQPVDITAITNKPLVAEPPKQQPRPTATQFAIVADKTYRVGGEVKPPAIKSAPPPPYPPLARAARVQGTVRLSGIISRDGTVRSLELVSGHPLLVQAAVNAVKAWLYDPARLNGQPVDVILQIDVNFRLGE